MPQNNPEHQYRPKPPRQGTEKGQYKLVDWVPKMMNYMELVGLRDITLNDSDLADMTNAQQKANASAKYLLLDNLSPLYCELVSSKETAYQIWMTLNQVSCWTASSSC